MIRPFGLNEFLLILSATQWTIMLSAIAFAGGAIGGLLIALMRVSDWKIANATAFAFVATFQGTPLLMQLFVVFFGASVIGLEVNPWSAAAIALTLHASAYLGDIWRGCIQAVPKGQWEAGRALGLTYRSLMADIVLPQAVRIGLPPTVGFLVQLIKATSLTAIIGFVELTRTGQIINNITFQPFLVFGTVAGLYFAMCWPISLLSARLEQRYARAYR